MPIGLDISLDVENALKFAQYRANRDQALVSVYKKGNTIFVRPSHHEPPEGAVEVETAIPEPTDLLT